MFFFFWIIIGLAGGYVGSRLIANERGEALAPYLALGAAGAVIGGGALALLGVGTFSELNLWSALGAALGAISALALYSMFWRQTA
jgi:uncharacterized membrane protein YeaQ/YmgE (transglycosylase-associated protein family)